MHLLSKLFHISSTTLFGSSKSLLVIEKDYQLTLTSFAHLPGELSDSNPMPFSHIAPFHQLKGYPRYFSEPSDIWRDRLLHLTLHPICLGKLGPLLLSAADRQRGSMSTFEHM
jgi:hypothetical protein